MQAGAAAAAGAEHPPYGLPHGIGEAVVTREADLEAVRGVLEEGLAGNYPLITDAPPTKT